MAKFKPYEIGLDKPWTIDVKRLLPEHHIAFSLERYVAQLDTSEIEGTYSEIGQRALHPKLLLCILFLGYIQGIRSGRKLTTACSEHIVFIYISKGYFPKKSVINDFRKANVDLFKSYFQQFLVFFEEEQRSASTSIFDGSKILANASRFQSRDKATYERWIAHLEQDIATIEAELASAAAEQQKELEQQLQEQQELCKNIKTLIAPLEKKEAVVNLTDPDAARMKGKKGGMDTYYNVQVGCNVHQTILHADVCAEGNDKKQLQSGIEGVRKNTGQVVNKAIGDSGYASFNNYEYLEKENIIGYIPDQDFNKDFKDKPFHREHFKKHPDKDELLCPKDKPLVFFRNKKDDTNTYKVYKGTTCNTCPFKEKCTKAEFRTVAIEQREPLRQQMRQRLQSKEGQEIYKKRLHPVEAIFGHLKFNLGYTHFLLRGLDKVRAEFLLMCIGYNLKKLITKFHFFYFLLFHKTTQLSNSFLSIFSKNFFILDC